MIACPCLEALSPENFRGETGSTTNEGEGENGLRWSRGMLVYAGVPVLIGGPLEECVMDVFSINRTPPLKFPLL